MIVLTDAQVRDILESLTPAELDVFREDFANALYQYSTDTGIGEDAVFQTPHRTSTYAPKSDATTLYMPSSGPQGMGVKVVTLSSPREDAPPPSAAQRPSSAQPKTIRPTGALTLFSSTGEPLGFLHCGTLTGFRTALASMCLLHRRKKVKTLTVFGAGIQAYWHIRLSLMMRGAEIKRIHLINKAFSDSAREILQKLSSISTEIKAREGWIDTKIDLLTPGYGQFDRVVRDNVRAADVIYCCTPSTKDLFDGSVLASHDGRKKGRLIVAVGSYQPHMRELPEDLVLQAVNMGGGDKKCASHYHKHAQEGGVIVVDTIKGVKTEAGEIIHANIDPSRLVELGELVMLRKLEDSEKRALDKDDDDDVVSYHDTTCRLTPTTTATSTSGKLTPTTTSTSNTGNSLLPSSLAPPTSFSSMFRRRSRSKLRAAAKLAKDETMTRWLYKGNVIYKSVGMGTMDLVAGMHVVRLAKAKGIGLDVPGF
ncbi:hypothetical protein BROUX41_003471 [Berkeleyomyces rouxiae]|uniref:uncharacterized protein n=1 Tax=Berkeleyomyces rouxiae TaxID=2035830 RepID=UPI003B7EE350